MKPNHFAATFGAAAGLFILSIGNAPAAEYPIGTPQEGGGLLSWANDARMAALVLAASWSLYLTWRITGHYRSSILRLTATAVAGAAIAVGLGAWLPLFRIW